MIMSEEVVFTSILFLCLFVSMVGVDDTGSKSLAFSVSFICLIIVVLLWFARLSGYYLYDLL